MTILIYLCIGALAGFVSGLFGGGAGLIMVPAILFIMQAQHFSMNAMHIAIGTTGSACIIMGVIATWKQNKHHNVDWQLIKKILLGLIAGTITGALLAKILPTQFLQTFYGVTMIVLGFWMIWHKDTSRKWSPTFWGYNSGAFITSTLNTLMGVATFIVPYLRKCGFDIRQAVGNATVCALIISTLIGISFALTGLGEPNLPPYSLGYVNLPILIPFALGSSVAAFYGAKVTHMIPRWTLQYSYIVMLFAIGLKMLW